MGDKERERERSKTVIVEGKQTWSWIQRPPVPVVPVFQSFQSLGRFKEIKKLARFDNSQNVKMSSSGAISPVIANATLNVGRDSWVLTSRFRDSRNVEMNL
jgi:hypothetical protein